MLLSDFLKESTASLEPLYPAKEARAIVLQLCEARIGTKNYTHILNPEYEVPEKALPGLQADMKRLSEGEPIQYVLGHTEFCGMTFKVDGNVLIPRPETELLVSEAVKLGGMFHRMRIPFGKNAEPVRILDLCTGSGCIAWVLALAIPTARVVAVDISEGALEVARNQDFSAELKEKGALAPEFVKADVLDPEFHLDKGKFDLIVSNPPYIKDCEKAQMRKNVLDYEPATALFVPDDDPLVFYRAIAEISSRYLAPEGMCLTEINETLGPETAAVFKAAGFSKTETVKDFYEKNRFIFYSR
ncbi:MAG: peptide chain release factor N(5)-glutamine methyltransferase [Bacteroidales bacterium]|nr:peptide chain release factor N(5)-glutamine methyltransferase [Bacteroidales bacterium]